MGFKKTNLSAFFCFILIFCSQFTFAAVSSEGGSSPHQVGAADAPNDVRPPPPVAQCLWTGLDPRHPLNFDVNPQDPDGALRFSFEIAPRTMNLPWSLEDSYLGQSGDIDVETGTIHVPQNLGKIPCVVLPDPITSIQTVEVQCTPPNYSMMDGWIVLQFRDNERYSLFPTLCARVAWTIGGTVIIRNGASSLDTGSAGRGPAQTKAEGGGNCGLIQSDQAPSEDLQNLGIIFFIGIILLALYRSVTRREKAENS